VSMTVQRTHEQIFQLEGENALLRGKLERIRVWVEPVKYVGGYYVALGQVLAILDQPEDKP